jgi:hypothetical protein
MTKYYPSLEERRLRIFENCCGGGDMGGMGDDTSGDEGGGFGAEDGSSQTPELDKALKKLKKRKRKENG